MSKTKKTGYGIIGLGRFGLALTRMLSEANQEVLAIDEDENKIRKVRNYAEEAFVVGELTKEALEDTGISECDTVIICISKVDVSVLTAQIVLELGVPRVIAKADSPEHGMILEKMGVEGVHPETETAAKWVSVLLESKAIDLMRLNNNYVVSEIAIPEELKNNTVGDLEAEKYGLKLVALETERDNTILDFTEDDPLKKVEAIVVIGKFSEAERFEREVMN